jgi:hypothetical protein
MSPATSADSPFDTSDAYVEHMVNNGFDVHVVGGKTLFKLAGQHGEFLRHPFPFEMNRDIGRPGSPAVAREELEVGYNIPQ